MADFITVARVGDIPDGEGHPLRIGNHAIALFREGDTYYALDDHCPHMGDSLGLGEVRDGTVICDRHLWSFRLADGQCIDAPRLKATTFETRVVGGEIQVRIGE